MSDYTPNIDDLVRGFRAPWHSKPPQGEGESFAEYLGRLSIQSMEIQIADEDAARRGIARIKADALREFADHHAKVLADHGHALDEGEIESVNGWIDDARKYANWIEGEA